MNDDPTTTDLLSRHGLAKSLASLIVGAEDGESFRIGIYGGWGEGKTSLMRMMQLHFLEAGVRTAFVLPWMANSSADLTASILDAIASAAEVGMMAKKIGRVAGLETGNAWKELADTDWRLKLLEKTVGGVISTASERLSSWQDKKTLQKIQGVLKSGKIVVFVDDVDRTEPTLVPKLLLDLREAISLPNLFYVIGLSPAVVQEALTEAHPGYSEPFRFLEKIIEYPVFLPRPTSNELRQFAKALVESAPGVDLDSLDSIQTLLPDNARRLKLFIRVLTLISPTLSRFDRDEISLPALYLVQLLLLEFPNESRALIANDKDVKWIEGVQTRGLLAKVVASGTEAEPSLPAAVTALNDDESSRDRFVALSVAIGERLSPASAYDMRDMFQIVQVPPILTRKEFVSKLGGFGDLSPEAVADELTRWITAASDPLEQRRVVFLHSVEYHRQLWEDLIELDVQEEMDRRLVALDKVTGYLRVQLFDMDAFGAGGLSASDWSKLHAHLSDLSRFTKPPDVYAFRRATEIELIRSSLNGASAELKGKVFLSLQRRFPSVRGDSSPAYRKAIEKIKTACETAVAEALLARFWLPDGVDVLYANDTPFRAVAFDSRSRFHSRPFRRRLQAALATARSNVLIQQNALSFLRMIAYGASSGLFPATACRTLLSDQSLVAGLWRAGTSRRLNFRTMGTLIQERAAMIEQLGIPEKKLPKPKWWKLLEKHFESASEAVAAAEERSPVDER